MNGRSRHEGTEARRHVRKTLKRRRFGLRPTRLGFWWLWFGFPVGPLYSQLLSGHALTHFAVASFGNPAFFIRCLLRPRPRADGARRRSFYPYNLTGARWKDDRGAIRTKKSKRRKVKKTKSDVGSAGATRSFRRCVGGAILPVEKHNDNEQWNTQEKPYHLAAHVQLFHLTSRTFNSTRSGRPDNRT